MSTRAKTWLISLILIATALRLNGLFANTFYADEALFASWARQIAVWRDPLLVSQAVDKPPLLFYIQAIFFPILGPVEWAARLPDLIASITLIPLSGLLAWGLFRNERLAVLTAALVTFSPLLIQFSATAYTDPLLTTLLVVSLYFITRTRLAVERGGISLGSTEYNSAFISGVFFGFAAATKYQAILFLPLLIGLAIIYKWNRSIWIRWLSSFGAVLLSVLIWDLARVGAANIWNTQIASFGGARLAWSWELWPRLETWTELWRYTLVSTEVAMIVLLGSIPFFILATRMRDKFTSIDQLMVIFVLGYFIVHWFVAVPIWDRYLLAIAPIYYLLLARIVWRIYYYVKQITDSRWTSSRQVSYLFWFVTLFLLALQIPLARSAYGGEFPVGGRPEADGGIAALNAALKDQPEGTVLYDHWFSWQWRYYLFDTNVFVSWFPDPDALAEDLQVFGDSGSRRFITLPSSPEAQPVIRAVRSAGYDLRAVDGANTAAEGSITLFQIVSR
jgi:4-amino-4-deoxy-L-arabinose transferase-like glycosyltransferase